jgi:hypothetical protein
MIYKNPHKEREIILSQADSEFINLVSNRITMYKQIPYDVPFQLIVDIIKESALMFFRYGYFRAQENKMFYLPLDELKKFGNVYPVNSEYPIHSGIYAFDEYNYPDSTGNIQQSISNKDSRSNPHYRNDKTGFLGYTVKLPGFVNAIYNIFETNQNKTFSALRLLENMQYMGQVSPYGQSLAGINSSLYIIEAVCKLVEGQAMESILNKGLPFSFNNSTHSLTFMSDIQHSLLLECVCNVHIENLYNDDLFIRHVIARVKQELRRKIGSHTIQLPGDVTINVDELCNNIEDVEKVEELLKQASGIGDILLYR